MSIPSWREQYTRVLRHHLRDLPEELVNDFVAQIDGHITDLADDAIDAARRGHASKDLARTPRRDRARRQLRVAERDWSRALTERDVVRSMRPAKQMAIDFHNAQLAKVGDPEPIAWDSLTLIVAVLLCQLQFPSTTLSLLAHLGAVLAMEATVIAALARRSKLGKLTKDLLALLPWTRYALGASAATSLVASFGTAILELHVRVNEVGIFFDGRIQHAPIVAAIAALLFQLQRPSLERLQRRLKYFVDQLACVSSISSEIGAIDIEL